MCKVPQALRLEDEFKSVKEYALPLIKAGLDFQYYSCDCAEIFLK